MAMGESNSFEASVARSELSERALGKGISPITSELGGTDKARRRAKKCLDV